MSFAELSISFSHRCLDSCLHRAEAVPHRAEVRGIVSDKPRKTIAELGPYLPFFWNCATLWRAGADSIPSVKVEFGFIWEAQFPSRPTADTGSMGYLRSDGTSINQYRVTCRARPPTDYDPCFVESGLEPLKLLVSVLGALLCRRSLTLLRLTKTRDATQAFLIPSRK